LLPGMADLATLLVNWIHNDSLWLLVPVQDDRLQPATAGLVNLRGRHSAEWKARFAGSSIAVIPTVLVDLFRHRFLARGLTMGSSQGVARMVRRLKRSEVGWCASE